MTDYVPFKKRVSFEDRKNEAEKKKQQYPQLVPLIVEKHKKCSLSILEKTKFLVSSDLKLFELQQSIRKKLKMEKTESLFFFISGNKLDKLDSLLKDIYEKSKDSDGFLYIEYSNFETFGKK